MDNKLLEETYIKEIAFKGEESQAQVLLDNLCNILRGEHIPVRFFDKQTNETLIAPNQKLTKRVLQILVDRWISGEKFDIDFVGELATNKQLQKNISLRLLAALEPDKDWM